MTIYEKLGEIKDTIDEHTMEMGISMPRWWKVVPLLKKSEGLRSDVKTLLNLYEDSSQWKPFHHDAAGETG